MLDNEVIRCALRQRRLLRAAPQLEFTDSLTPTWFPVVVALRSNFISLLELRAKSTPGDGRHTLLESAAMATTLFVNGAFPPSWRAWFYSSDGPGIGGAEVPAILPDPPRGPLIESNSCPVPVQEHRYGVS